MRYVIAYESDRKGNGRIYWSGKFRTVGINMSVMIKQSALLHEAYICDTRAEAQEKLVELIDEEMTMNLNNGETWLVEEVTDKELFDARLKGK